MKTIRKVLLILFQSSFYYPERINFDSPAHRAGLSNNYIIVLKGQIKTGYLFLMNPFRIRFFLSKILGRCPRLSKFVLSGQNKQIFSINNKFLFLFTSRLTLKCELLYICLLFMSSSVATEKNNSANIKEQATSIEKACEEQQKSIANLVSALKEIKKVINMSEEKNKPKKKEAKNPFKDKQKYFPPKMDPKKNPENQMKELLEKQKEILKDMDKESQKCESQKG